MPELHHRSGTSRAQPAVPRSGCRRCGLELELKSTRISGRRRPNGATKSHLARRTVDVHRVVESLPIKFTLAELYVEGAELAALDPVNRHVRDKIRQQLQVLRDAGRPRFRGQGVHAPRTRA
ncbi:hypothetical protein [Nocardioides sp. Soil805]|uniref:hypothetical protein n=1 Tax=Nocardioides sp. Soil805 TaxID=1736416 RepID=UPI003FA6015A